MIKVQVSKVLYCPFLAIFLHPSNWRLSNDPGLGFFLKRLSESFHPISLRSYHHRTFKSYLALFLTFSTHLFDVCRTIPDWVFNDWAKVFISLGPDHHRTFNSYLALFLLFSCYSPLIYLTSPTIRNGPTVKFHHWTYQMVIYKPLRVPSHLFGRSGRSWMDECEVTSLGLLDGIQPLGVLSNSHSSPVTKRTSWNGRLWSGIISLIGWYSTASDFKQFSPICWTKRAALKRTTVKLHQWAYQTVGIQPLRILSNSHPSAWHGQWSGMGDYEVASARASAGLSDGYI